MKSAENRTITRYLKWGLALGVGITADVLSGMYADQKLLILMISAAVIAVYIFCFDIYRKESRNILKLAYIVTCVLSGAYYGLECIFLCIYELITDRQKGPDGNKKTTV